jgi:TonB family protein
MLSNLKLKEIKGLLTTLSLSVVIFVAHGNGQVLGVATDRSYFPLSQTSGEWDRYMIRGGEFSVLLPTVPAMSTYELREDPFSKRSRIRHIIAAYSQGVVYAIYVAERKQTLEDYIGESRYRSPADSTREVKVGNSSGKEYAFQDANNKRVTQYFITKRYLYSFIAQGSHIGNPDVGIPKFFESIKFKPPNTGLILVDGPGEQPAGDNAAVTDGSVPRILTGKEVTQKARIITKPEPTYTEDARKNQVTGTVVLRGVLASSGAVTNIRLVSGLPSGLSDRAIAAAREIRFIPSIKDGHFVSMWIQLEYNFNLY